MKNLLLVLLTFSFYSCSNNYSSILKDLSKNHVLIKDNIGESLYFEYFELNKEEYSKLLIEYKKGIKKFYNSDKEIIDYLLEFKNNKNELCSWIKTKSPYSSEINESDILTKSRGALLLIDNYLSNSNFEKIESTFFIKDLSYETFMEFYKNNKDLNKNQLRRAYVKHFS